MYWIAVIINLIFILWVVKYLIDILLVFWGNIFYGVPYVPTKHGLIKEAVKSLKLKKGQKVIELGSGDGRVSIMFAKEHPVEVLGVEKIRWLLWNSRLRALLTPFKKGRVRFERKDLFRVSLKEVDVVYMYLLPWMIKKLIPRIEKELKKGALIVSFDYLVQSEKLLLWEEIGKRQKIRVYKRL